jgi:hypothetical protein
MKAYTAKEKREAKQNNPAGSYQSLGLTKTKEKFVCFTVYKDSNGDNFFYNSSLMRYMKLI